MSLQFTRHVTKVLRCNGFVADKKYYTYSRKRGIILTDISVKMAKNLLKRKIIMHQTKGMKGENQYGDAESDKGICGTI